MDEIFTSKKSSYIKGKHDIKDDVKFQTEAFNFF